MFEREKLLEDYNPEEISTKQKKPSHKQQPSGEFDSE